jgi:hypothetical protein
MPPAPPDQRFSGIMIETQDPTNLIIGNVEVVLGGKGLRMIKLHQMDRWKQYRTRRYHQAKFGELVGVWKIISSREFEQHLRQRVRE